MGNYLSKESLFKSPTLQGLGNINKARIIDQTDNTDDPGNTNLWLAFVPFDDNECEQPEKSELDQITKELQENCFTSAGDCHEEIITLAQNNEFLIILNANG